jgi:hypothetical protein
MAAETYEPSVAASVDHRQHGVRIALDGRRLHAAAVTLGRVRHLITHLNLSYSATSPLYTPRQIYNFHS